MLDVIDLNIEFHDHLTPETVVYDFDLHLDEGEIVGIVGESGSGKSMSALAIAGLLSRKHMKKRGQILFDGVDLLTCSRNVLRKYQGNDICMVFQEPMTSLNPVKRIGWQVGESLRIHTSLSEEQIKEKVLKILKDVELDDPEGVYDKYPHELSGGMRQRVMIAIALACEPKLLIADEPTTALDVTIQARILELIMDIQQKMKLSVIYITHDLGVVAKVADYVNVMYAGKIVEVGNVNEIFYEPAHPYTWGLLSSMPDLDTDDDRLYSIPGSPPNLLHEPAGDAFAARNQFALAIDEKEAPPMFRISETHSAATWLLHPDAPKVEKPPELEARLERARKEVEKYL